jgi:molybdopterin molybdotransferase
VAVGARDAKDEEIVAEKQLQPERLIGPDRALELVLEAAKRLDAVELDIGDVAGTVLAEDVFADRPYPPFDRAAMDGFAVRVADGGRDMPVAGRVTAGKATGILPQGAVVEIMTGAPCPVGTEAVVPIEHVEPGTGGVRLPSGIETGAHITWAGSECEAGARVLAKGELVTALRLALLATVGAARVRVHRRPSLAIVSTGDELVPSDRTPEATEIRDSNGPMLRALAKVAGVETVEHVVAVDELEALLGTLQALDRVDVIVTCGGVSAGRLDLIPDAVAAWGGHTVFHGVLQKPGKPLLFATRGRQLVFGLPGNPLSAHICFHRYVRAALLAMMGRDARPSSGTGTLERSVAVRGGRTVFQPCQVAGEGTRWTLTPLATRGSADVFTAAGASAVARLDPSDESYEPGSEVSFEWLEQAMIVG